MLENETNTGILVFFENGYEIIQLQHFEGSIIPRVLIPFINGFIFDNKSIGKYNGKCTNRLGIGFHRVSLYLFSWSY